MQTSFDSLLVALLVALSPPEPEGQTGASADSFRQGFQQGYERLMVGPEGPALGEATDCRYFADAVARGKCMTRARRAFSGAGETTLTFPDQIIWIVPGDPEMPFKFGPGSRR